MLVLEESLPGRLIVILSGRFGPSNDIDLEKALVKGESQRVKRVVFNLEKVSSIDSTGIGLLFLTFYRLQQKGITLSLVNPKPDVRKLLDFVKIPFLMPIYQSNEEALTSRPPQRKTLRQTSKKKPTQKIYIETGSLLYHPPNSSGASA